MDNRDKVQQFKIRIFDGDGDKFSDSENSETYDTRPMFNTARE